ncbi:fasciclin-1-like [Liolophura sinensis]|uniref:fasciclin-1-like n=1 Tax=Liolophura sinensis TaxID=3198878 RepID=UPI0031597416
MRIRATTPTERLLYFNTFTGNGGKTIYTINGARILTSGYMADNGILYIIDRVMYPFGSEKTVTEYDNNPDVPYLSFTSVTALQEINTPLFQEGADPGNFFTVFSPNDSYTYPISREAQQKFYTNWTLINDTIKAHIVKDKVLCLPAEGNIPEAMSLNGQLKFTRRDGKVYVENNRVRAEVIIPNIPLRNGVLHVIDNLLYFIYDTIHQKLSQLYESRTFLAITDTIPDFTSRLRSETSEMTIFVPETSAFAKVPSRLQGEVEGNITLLMSLLNSHVILGQVLDIDTLLRLENITTLGNRTIRVMKMNNGVYLQHNGLRTRVTRGDIGCTNGVVHLINDVMIDSHLTVWENIESQTQLSTVFDLMRNHVDIRTTLSAEDGSYVTVFLPGTFFLNELPGYSREMLSAGGSRVHEALIGHIVENAFMGSSDFEDGVERKMTTKSGRNIHITRRGHAFFVNIGCIRCEPGSQPAHTTCQPPDTLKGKSLPFLVQGSFRLGQIMNRWISCLHMTTIWPNWELSCKKNGSDFPLPHITGLYQALFAQIAKLQRMVMRIFTRT